MKRKNKKIVSARANEMKNDINTQEDQACSEPVCEKSPSPPPDIPATVEVIKHPLEHTWSFWLQDIDSKKTWEQNLVELTTFDTVEDYWCLYHHMKLPSELLVGHDYCIFKKGIVPMWEHKENARGGRLILMVDRRNIDMLDRLWLDIVLLMIGENFEDNDIINGVVVNIRIKHKICIWIKNTSTTAISRIESNLKNVLGMKWRFDYLPHVQSQAKKH